MPSLPATATMRLQRLTLSTETYKSESSETKTFTTRGINLSQGSRARSAPAAPQLSPRAPNRYFSVLSAYGQRLSTAAGELQVFFISISSSNNAPKYPKFAELSAGGEVTIGRRNCFYSISPARSRVRQHLCRYSRLASATPVLRSVRGHQIPQIQR